MEVTALLSYATVAVDVVDITQVGEARRAAAELSANLQVGGQTAGEIAIVVTELGTNLVKHGGGGQLLFNSIWSPDGSTLDILAVDKGAGMADISKCMEDGYSSGGTAGNGLGAVRRLARHFDIVAAPGRGTVILARMGRHRVPVASPAHIGVVNLPLRGEPVSGDSWALRTESGSYSLMIADGLGHGDFAAVAARAAIRAFADCQDPEPAATLKAAHGVMRSTRGAAAAVACLDLASQQVTFCGVGNIAGGILTEDSKMKSMVSLNGIVGHEARRFTEFAYAWSPGAVMVMHSDGLQSQWSLDPYPGILRRDPALIAAILYRDSSRGRDDVTVAVLKA